ncbi:MAG: transposase [Pirellulales bacterium]
MPRTARAIEAGTIYHVLNRGNGRMRLFHKPGDYEAFEQVLLEGMDRYPVQLLTYCIMPNHWHLVVRPKTDDALGRWMGWVGVTHVRRHHAHYRSAGGGHLYQGRFKSFPVATDEYFLALCRYVEANPRRAKLVERAEDWRWSGLWRRGHRATGLTLSAWPLSRPQGWLKLVNARLPKQSLDALRECVQRGRPSGPPKWVQTTSKRLGLEFTLRRPGRPRKPKNE